MAVRGSDWQIQQSWRRRSKQRRPQDQCSAPRAEGTPKSGDRILATPRLLIQEHGGCAGGAAGAAKGGNGE